MKNPKSSSKTKNPAILYIGAKSRIKPEDYNIDSSFIEKLPKEVFLCYTVQFQHQAEELKKALEKKSLKIAGFQQVLGCTKLKIKDGAAIILVSHGRFHALNLAIQNNRPIIVYNKGSHIIIGRKEIEEHKEKKKNQINLLLHSNNIGIIVSLKPGQENLQGAEKLMKKIKTFFPEKKVFLFISSQINTSEFENFPIDFWINSACPGLINDSQKIANLDDILAFLQQENIYFQK